MIATPAVATTRPRPSRVLHIANVGISQLDTAIVTAGGLAVTPAVLHGLGDDGYGGWLLINSFIGYMRLLDLGTSAGTMKLGAGAEARGNARDLAAVIDTSAFLFAGIGSLALAVSFGLTYVLPRLFATLAPEALTIFVLGGALAIDLAFRPFAAALRMRSLFFVYDAIEIATYVIFKLLVLLWFASRGALSYRVLGLLTLAETVTRIGLVVAAACVLSPAVRRIHPFRPDRAMIRRLFGMSVAMSIIQLADVVRFQVDAAVIGYLLPESPRSIAVFGVGMRLPTVAYTAIGVIGAVLVPRFSGLSERGDIETRERLLAKASLVTGLVSSFAFVNLAIFGPRFLALWLQKPWVSTSGIILVAVLPAYWFALLAAPGSSLLIGRGSLRGLVVLTVVEAAVNFVLSIVLVARFGIFGVVMGTAVPLVLFRGIAFPLLLRREIGLPLSAYVRTHARAMLVGLVYLAVASVLGFVPFETYARLLVLGVSSTAIFGLVLWALVPEVRDWALRR